MYSEWRLSTFQQEVKKIITHRLGWPGFQPLRVKRIEEPGGTRAWRRRWQLCRKEAAPLEGSASCVFQRSWLPTLTRQQKDCQRLKKKNAKEKKNFFKSLKWSIFSISNKQGCHSHLWFWPSKWEFLNPEGPQKEQSLWDSCRHDTPYRQEWGGGQLGMWKRRVLDPDSWGACERNEFSKSRRLHLPRQARVPAKSHQSCPTLCNHMDCSLPRLLCPWDSPGMNTGVGCHALFSHT